MTARTVDTRHGDEDGAACDLAAMIREARVAVGLTQAEMARRAGITPSYLCRIEAAAWERGGSWPSDPVLRAIARVTSCSSTDLVECCRRQREGSGVDAIRRVGPGNGGSSYTVSVGGAQVGRSVLRLLERSPARGSLRLTTQSYGASGVGGGALDADGAAALAERLAEDTTSILYCVSIAGPTQIDRLRQTTLQLAAGRTPDTVHNIRARCCFTAPAMLDVIIGAHEALIVVPDRRGHPFPRASLLIDDPDFVAVLKDWFDDFVWEQAGPYVDVPFDGIDAAFDRAHELVGDVAAPVARRRRERA